MHNNVSFPELKEGTPPESRRTYFHDTLFRGLVWEKRVVKYLKRVPQTISVKHVSSDPVYQHQNINILWQYRSGSGEVKTHSIDVTANRTSTNRVYLETISNNQQGKLGKFYTSPADFVFYVYPTENSLLIMRLEKVREWFKNNQERYRTFSSAHKSFEGRVIQVSQCASIPREDILKIEGVVFVPNFYVKSPWEKIRDSFFPKKYT